MKHTIKQCPLYGGKYWADKEGHVYLDAEGKVEVGVRVYNDRYLRTTMSNARVHRIIYYAFNPDAPDKGYDIHHLNEDKTDNRLENLQLLTHVQHRRLHMTGEKNPSFGKTGTEHPVARPVLQYTKEDVLVAEYGSTLEAERTTGIRHSDISAVCLHRPKHKTAGGYIWRFKFC